MRAAHACVNLENASRVELTRRLDQGTCKRTRSAITIGRWCHFVPRPCARPRCKRVAFETSGIDLPLWNMTGGGHEQRDDGVGTKCKMMEKCDRQGSRNETWIMGMGRWAWESCDLRGLPRKAGYVEIEGRAADCSAPMGSTLMKRTDEVERSRTPRMEQCTRYVLLFKPDHLQIDYFGAILLRTSRQLIAVQPATVCRPSVLWLWPRSALRL
jgi:hypothetical protein